MPNCPQCYATKRYLDEDEIEYSMVDITKDEKAYELVSSLGYKEAPIVVGKADDIAGSTMTLWVNPLNDNWTIVATKKDLSCVIGTGTHFKIMPMKKSNNI
jgi:glutaredoxin-like protein NrdH